MDKTCSDLLHAEITRLQQRVTALERALKETMGLASGLDDDDPWFGERRSARAVLDRAEAALEARLEEPE